jgi:hypothetical protein
MWNKPTEKELKKIPAFYSNEKTPPEETMIHMHFFIGGCDWYCSEYSSEEQMFFAFAILNSDLMNAEWGYVSMRELCEIKVGGFLEVDRDLHFKPTKTKDIKKIREAQGWF